MVVSSPSPSEKTGWPIGFWGAELTHPLRIFQEAGFEVDLASTAGGKVVIDGYSDPTDDSKYSANDVITLGYMQQESFQSMLDTTVPVANIQDISVYDAIFLVGGQGPIYTFRGNDTLKNLFTKFYESGKPRAAVCHATCILLEAKKSDGKLIVDGHTWTGFANSEEDVADSAVGTLIQPYRIEDEAAKLSNTKFRIEAAFSSYAIADNNLVTADKQTNWSAAKQWSSRR